VKTADLELARRCHEGDADAFEELYRKHAGRLYSLMLRMLGSAGEAEDLVQDVFLQAHRKLGGFRGESSLGTWLYRMA
jgi:RNA polymerase sigma-70 factor (ECF subfamily)